MAEPTRETRTDTTYDDGTGVETREVATMGADRGVTRVQAIVRLLYAILATLLVIRIILSLLGANLGNGFASFIYHATNPFVAPFRGLLGYNLSYGQSRFEIETAIAIIVYGLIAYVIIRLLGISKTNPEA